MQYLRCSMKTLEAKPGSEQRHSSATHVEAHRESALIRCVVDSAAGHDPRGSKHLSARAGGGYEMKNECFLDG
jgi:hypothetical protein